MRLEERGEIGPGLAAYASTISLAATWCTAATIGSPTPIAFQANRLGDNRVPVQEWALCFVKNAYVGADFVHLGDTP